ncbi:MAG: DNA polymerase III subunit delta, partial [bacterium]
GFLERCFTELKRKGHVVFAPRMYDEQKVRWIIERARGANVALSHEQAELVYARGGADLRHLANEIEKLALFCGGREPSNEEIGLVVTSCEEEYIFDLTDAVFNGDRAAAACLLRRATEGDRDPHRVVAALASHLRTVWQARALIEAGYLAKLPREYKTGGGRAVVGDLQRVPEDLIGRIAESRESSIAGKSPFFVYKCARQARRLPMKVLERWAYYCAQADRGLKGIRRGAGPGDIVLERLVADMLKETGRRST